MFYYDLRPFIKFTRRENNVAAGRYIRSHEEVQRLSIRNRMHDFMQQNGTELAAILAPELMGIKNQPAMLKSRALDRSNAFLLDALAAWLEEDAETSYAAKNNDILTTIGFMP